MSGAMIGATGSAMHLGRAALPPAWRFQASARLALAVALTVALTAAAGTAAAQDGLGRLFFTPAQRVQLDESRRRPAAPEPVRDVAIVPQPVQPQSLSVDGIVRRNDGQATVWLNRKPTAAPQAGGPVRIGPVRDATEGADLRLPDSGRQVRIKVGQEVDVQSGRVQERYRQPPAAPPPSASGPVSGSSSGASTGSPTGSSSSSSPAYPPTPSAPGQGVPAEPVSAPRSGSASSNADGAPTVPATRPDAAREPARDAAVERLLRELGRRLDEPQRDPARGADPVR